MRKILLLTLTLIVLLSGCGKERGEVEELHPELYYVRTDYYSEPFAVMWKEKTDTGYDAYFALDPDIDFKSFYEVEPNTYISVALTDKEYNDLTGGMEVFEATFSVVSVVNPADMTLHTFIIDINDDTQVALRKAVYENDYVCKIPQDIFEDYLRTYKYVYTKL